MATIFDNVKITIEGGNGALDCVKKAIDEFDLHEDCLCIKRRKKAYIIEELGLIMDEEDAADFAEALARATNGRNFIIEGITSSSLSDDTMEFYAECNNGKLTIRYSDWFIFYPSDLVEDYDTYEEYLEDYDEIQSEEDFIKVKENEETYLIDGKIYVDLPLGEAILLDY